MTAIRIIVNCRNRRLSGKGEFHSKINLAKVFTADI